MIFRRLILLPALVLLLQGGFARDGNPALDVYMIPLAPDSSHSFVFSNKIAAFWFGETAAANSAAHQGYTILEQRYLQDYVLADGGGEIARTGAQGVSLYPDRLVRDYSGLRETFYFIDSLNVLLVGLSADSARSLEFRPAWDGALGALSWRWDREAGAAVARIAALDADKPAYVALAGWGKTAAFSPLWDEAGAPGNAGNRPETPLPLNGLRASGLTNGYVAVVFAADEAKLRTTLQQLRRQTGRYIAQRGARLSRLLMQAALNSPDVRINQAYAWALFSMDDLVTRQRGEGIWAGLPWFNNYWGRDSFIALPGALLCSGQFETARRVLTAFARFQNDDPDDPSYGRIPNRVRLNEIIYNTTDGTPWFVIACEKYVQYSGDERFVGEIFPVLRKAMDGAIRYHLDESGFLTHADAETWMDAVGSEGPWSPRGDRAVEIQVLWMAQVRISADWAERLGYQEQAGEWRLLLARLRESFLRDFWDELDSRLSDHLNSDGTPDRQIRPNGLFALTIPKHTLLNSFQQTQVLREIMENLVYPWGVASLAQSDPNFHPYHHYPPYYVPDAAYHNGIIWTWVSGPLISALMPFNPQRSFDLLREASRQILEEDAVGSYSELLESWPRPGQTRVRISGTVSQAWNLAEYLRNWHEDVIGIRPDLPGKTIRLQPSLPEVWDKLDFKVRLGNDILSGSYRRGAGRLEITLRGKKTLPELTVQAQIPFGGEWVGFSTPWKGEQPLTILLMQKNSGLSVTAGGKALSALTRQHRRVQSELRFARPAMDLAIPTLRGPQYALISPEDATRRRGRLTPVIYDIKDRSNDDVGPAERYTYPTHPNFRPGIFDCRRVRIWRDELYYYFELEFGDLVDPGWHPEPGYQLTYSAITLNFEKLTGVRTTRIGMNANYSVPVEYAFNFIIYVGNGYRICDSRGETVAEYQPVDPQHPMGFPEEKRVAFSVPVQYLSERHLRNAVVLTGGQDDHGGGGVGEFRSVLKTAGEWNGGGGERESGNPNVYDVVFLRR